MSLFPTYGPSYWQPQIPQNNQMQYMQPQQAYMQQPQIQPQAQPQTWQQLSGKLVNNVEEITANDVPMNAPAYFPKCDGSGIYVKQWTANGTISTVLYQPANMQEEPKQDPIMDKLANIEKAIEELKTGGLLIES